MDSFFEKAKRIVSALAILGLVVGPLPARPVQKASAGAITYPSGYISFGSSVPGATTSVTFKFTVATAHQASSSFHIQLWSAPNDTFDTTNATLATTGFTPIQGFRGFDMTEVVVTNSNAIAAGSTVTLTFNNVKLPSSSGAMNIWTERFGQNIDGSPGSPDKGVPFELGDTVISGNVVVQSGGTETPLSGAQVELHNFNGTFNARTQTKSDGTYKLTGNLTSAKAAGDIWLEVRSFNDPSVPQREPEMITATSLPITNKKITLVKGDRTLKGKVSYTKSDGTVVGVCNAMVNLFGEQGKGWAAIQTDASGNYTTSSLTSGKYRLMVFRMPSSPNCPGGQQQPPPQPGQRPPDTGPKWAFAARPLLIDLENNTTLTKNIPVQETTATLKVKLEAPSGVDLSRTGGFLELSSGTFHQGEPIFSSGNVANVSFSVIPGSYNIRYFGRPPMPGETGSKLLRIENKEETKGIVVSANETVSVTAKLTDAATAGAQVKVKTVDKDTGAGLAGQFVVAFSGGPGGGPDHEFTPPAFGVTGSDGTATLSVSAGRGMVMSMGSNFKIEGSGGGPGPGGEGEKKFSVLAAGDEYVPDKGPQAYDVQAGKTVEINFPMAKAASTINVSVVKEDNTPVSGLFGFIPVLKKGGGFAGGQPLSSTGTAKIRVPNGTYIIGLGTPPGANLFSKEEKEVTVNNETKSTTLTVVPGNATVEVKLVDSKGATFDQFGGEAPIFSGGAFVPAHIEGGSGKAKVFGNGLRKWNVGEPRSFEFGFDGSDVGYVAVAKGSNQITPKAGETVTVTYEMLEKNATLTGTVEDDSGNKLGGVTVTVDNIDTTASGDVAEDFDFGRRFIEDVKTGKDGKFSIKVVPSASGKSLKVFASLPPEKGYAPTESASVAAGANKVTTVPTIKMKKFNASVDVTVNGSDGKPLSKALVTAFNNDGAISTATTDDNGKATVPVTNEAWQFQAVKDKETDYSSSSIQKVALGATDTKGSTTLVVQDFKDGLPSATTTQGDSSSTLTLTSLEKDGDQRMEITAPAQAFSSSDSSSGEVSSDTIQATITSTKEVPLQEGNVSVGPAYDVSFTSNGQEKEPNSTMSGEFKVTQGELDRVGIKVSEVQVKYYDETKGTWSSDGIVTGQPVETTMKKDDGTTEKAYEIPFTTNHSSTFAVVAAADTTSPAEATSITATGGKTKVTLTWTNPTDSDFDHLDIYRSENTSSIGDKVKTTAKADTSYEDTGLTNNKAYYYTFKSVDATGNVSAGTDQVVGVPTASAGKTLPKTGMPLSEKAGFDGKWLLLVLPIIGGVVLLRRKAVMG